MMLAFFENWFSYIMTNSSYLLEQFGTHAYLALTSVAFCIIIGLPLGIAIYLHRRWEGPVMTVINTVQTVPSMAMLTVLLIFFGLGTTTVVILVVLYSLLPIVKNTFAGLNSVNAVYLDSAKGMGMTQTQILLMVQIPLALPILLVGVKNALVLAVGTTTIGSFVGAGGLGDIILRGINTVGGTSIILTGALLCALIAFGFEALINEVEKQLQHSFSGIKKEKI
ncbi:ABC transporter permease [Lactococcus muris]|uniref:ABC transporter permease n=1 Tax=Lactococcus muris TaxID=2941330 RepID=A0ABV4D7Y8_9LACT